MRWSKVFGFSLLGLGAAVLFQGVASAQNAGDSGAGTELTQQVNLSPQEQLAQAQQYSSQMEQVRGNVQRMLEEARQERDVVKTLCLNDKLNQLDVAIRSAEERNRSLESAVKRGDSDLSNHEFTILTVLFQRTQSLAAEANQCVGKEIGVVGESSTTMDVDPDLPYDDASDYPAPATIVALPTCASCFK
ncbi:MAG: hypothetical protein HY908_10075 [Myxococcales bacterium]|nr:hypothetical protein [Myxococcales bacterium]